jgi:hypothetical protein
MELEVTAEDILIITHNQPFVKKYSELTITHVASLLQSIKNGMDESDFIVETNKELLKLIKAYKDIWISQDPQRAYFPNCVVCGALADDLRGHKCGLTVSLCREHGKEWEIIVRGKCGDAGERNWQFSEENIKVSRDVVKTLLKNNKVVIPGIKDENTVVVAAPIEPVIIPAIRNENEIVKEINYMNIHEHFVMCALEELNRPYFRKW